MLKTTTFICELSKKEQIIIKNELLSFLESEGYEDSEVEEILNNAMDGRITDLEDNLNVTELLNKIELLTNDNLIAVCNKWDRETKGNMLDSIMEDITEKGYTLKQSLNILVNEHFPIWIDEAEEDDKQFYVDFQSRFNEILKEMF